MKRHEDPLFETYREAFAQYEAPAPAGTLAAVHKKMNKKGFWYFSWTSLNVYTLSVLIAAGLAFSLFAYEGEESSALTFTPKAKDLSLAAMEKTQEHLSFNDAEENVEEDELNLNTQTGASEGNSLVLGLVKQSKGNAAATNNSKKNARALAVNLAQVQVRHEVILEKDLQRDQALNFETAIEELAASSAEKTEVPSADNAQGILDQAKTGAKQTGITLKSKQKVK